jgi:cell division protein FtsN
VKISQRSQRSQRGSVLVGIVIGVVLGLAVALAVAVYVTKVPIPFINKGQNRSPDQDAAESRKNKDWDPNAPLYGKNPAKPLPPAPAVVQPPAGVVQPAPAPPVATIPAPDTAAAAKGKSRDPLGDLAAKAVASGTDPFLYFVQAGAFRTPEDAEAQRAKLSLMGIEAKVSEREQSGRQVFRVRVGPFEKKEDADRQKEKLETGGIETALVRVQR